VSIEKEIEEEMKSQEITFNKEFKYSDSEEDEDDINEGQDSKEEEG